MCVCSQSKKSAPPRFRHKAIIQRQTETLDDYNQPEDTWTTHATVYCSIEPLRGSEYMRAQQMQATVSHRITLRYRADLKPTDRFLYDGRYFEIQSIINIEERDRFLEVMATEQMQ